MVFTTTGNGIAQLVFYLIFTGFIVYDFIVYLPIRSKFPRLQNLYLLGVLSSIAFVCFWRIINSAITISFENIDATDSKVAAVICFEYFGLAFYLLAFLFITLFLLPTQLANKLYLIPIYVAIGFLALGFILNIAGAGTYTSNTTSVYSYWYTYYYSSHSVDLYKATSAFYFITFFAIVAQSIIDFIFADSSVIANSPTLLALIIFPTLLFLLLRSIFGLLTASDANVFVTLWTILGTGSHFGGMELFPEIMIFIGLQAFLFFVAYDDYVEKAGLSKIMKGHPAGAAPTTTTTEGEGEAGVTTTTAPGAEVLTDGDTYIGDSNSKDIENSPGEYTEKPATTDYSGDLANEQNATDAIDMAKPQN
ncbi:unnamed protein product [[Candida] boidinii]|uniref:Unnamed protein product n=1 Tax=Candida boidinii TaxID=5477 RepID=A0ACB5TIZ7_CANBO|nr:unnamed protein product [[Candida] boidinii]